MVRGRWEVTDGFGEVDGKRVRMLRRENEDGSVSFRAETPPCGWIEHHSRCGLCARPWCRVQGHETSTGDGRGVFPLCEECWEKLTPAERMPFYEQLVESWVGMGMDADEAAAYLVRVRVAVEAGG